MLAELAMANAAFGVIKSAIGNGKDLAQVGKQIGDWIGAEETLKNKADNDKKSVFNKMMGKDTNDFESFLALDKMKEQRRILESHCRLYARPGMWDSFIEYQAQARKARREAEIRRKKEREELQEIIMIIGGSLFFITALVAAIYLVYVYQ
tara:strand:- start:230 stop:682 length:453 start_codon:yes stop_codon:yes gene_type:complete